MDVTKIPFVEKVGVVRQSGGRLGLPFNDSIHNHLQTVHASAQFALAETASGEALQSLFPELVGKVVPVLRDSNIKFKKPAQSTISAHASVADESVSKFRERFAKKGHASISVSVEVIDQAGVITSMGVFNWFVQVLRNSKHNTAFR